MVDDTDESCRKKRGRGGKGNQDELKRPPIVIRRIVHAVGHNEECIRRAELTKYRNRNPTLLSFLGDGEQQPRQKRENREEVPRQQVVAVLACRVWLELPKEDRIEDDSEEDRGSQTPFSLRPPCSPMPMLTFIHAILHVTESVLIEYDLTSLGMILIR